MREQRCQSSRPCRSYQPRQPILQMLYNHTEYHLHAVLLYNTMQNADHMWWKGNEHLSRMDIPANKTFLCFSAHDPITLTCSSSYCNCINLLQTDPVVHYLTFRGGSLNEKSYLPYFSPTYGKTAIRKFIQDCSSCNENRAPIANKIFGFSHRED